MKTLKVKDTERCLKSSGKIKLWFAAVFKLLCLMRISESTRLNVNKIFVGKALSESGTALKSANVSLRYGFQSIKEMYTDENGKFFCILPRKTNAITVRILNEPNDRRVNLSNRTYSERVFYITNNSAAKHYTVFLTWRSNGSLQKVLALLVIFSTLFVWHASQRKSLSAEQHCLKITSFENPYKYDPNPHTKNSIIFKEHILKLNIDSEVAKTMYFKKTSPLTFYQTLRTSEDVMILGINVTE